MKKNKIFIKNFIWNILGTGLNAFNSLFFMIAVTRINGLNDAGIFTLAFSTACILYVIGTYAGRVYQVTESDKTITDKEYVVNRVISCVLMLVMALVFVILRKYDLYKSIIFILLSTYKCLEAFCDVLYGIMQKNNLLHNVGKSYFFKAVLSVSLFIIIDLITKNLIYSCLAIIFSWLTIMLIYDMRITRTLIKNISINKVNIIKIFKNGFFVFIITFLGLYILNAPKYAIDNLGVEELQAIFGIIIMPATVMGLFAQFLIHPYLTTITELYNNRKYKQFINLLYKSIIYILAVGIVCCLAGYFLGSFVLGLIYNVDLSQYSLNLLFILIAATFYTMANIILSFLITMRYNFIQFIIYVCVSIFTLILSTVLTNMYQITGATIAYLATMILIFILYSIAIYVIFKFIKKKENLNESTVK